MHRVGDQPRLYCGARSTNHQDTLSPVIFCVLFHGIHRINTNYFLKQQKPRVSVPCFLLGTKYIFIHRFINLNVKGLRKYDVTFTSSAAKFISYSRLLPSSLVLVFPCHPWSSYVPSAGWTVLSR